MVGGKKVTVNNDITAQMGSDTGNAQETGELKDRDFFLGRNLKFGQIGASPPMPAQCTQKCFGSFGA